MDPNICRVRPRTNTPPAQLVSLKSGCIAGGFINQRSAFQGNQDANKKNIAQGYLLQGYLTPGNFPLDESGSARVLLFLRCPFGWFSGASEVDECHFSRAASWVSVAMSLTTGNDRK